MKRRNRNHSKPHRKPHTSITTKELAVATAEYDRESRSSPAPLRGEKLLRYKRAMARRGRPRIGKGSKAITVTLERSLLTRADRAAPDRHMTRSQLIASALSAHVFASENEN